jgi:hypothetical protein
MFETRVVIRKMPTDARGCFANARRTVIEIAKKCLDQAS